MSQTSCNVIQPNIHKTQAADIFELVHAPKTFTVELKLLAPHASAGPPNADTATFVRITRHT